MHFVIRCFARVFSDTTFDVVFQNYAYLDTEIVWNFGDYALYTLLLRLL